MFLCSCVKFQVVYFSRVVETLCKIIRITSIYVAPLYNTYVKIFIQFFLNALFVCKHFINYY